MSRQPTEQQPGGRRGIGDVEVAQALLVDPETRACASQSPGPPPVVVNDDDRASAGVDHAEHRDEHDDGRDHRQDDVAQDRRPASPVDRAARSTSAGSEVSAAAITIMTVKGVHCQASITGSAMREPSRIAKPVRSVEPSALEACGSPARLRPARIMRQTVPTATGAMTMGSMSSVRASRNAKPSPTVKSARPRPRTAQSERGKPPKIDRDRSPSREDWIAERRARSSPTRERADDRATRQRQSKKESPPNDCASGQNCVTATTKSARREKGKQHAEPRRAGPRRGRSRRDGRRRGEVRVGRSGIGCVPAGPGDVPRPG